MFFTLSNPTSSLSFSHKATQRGQGNTTVLPTFKFLFEGLEIALSEV